MNFVAHQPSGTEQSGFRPALIVAVPDFVAPPRFPGLFVVPFTSRVHLFTGRSDALYPMYRRGCGDLTRGSVALTDQLRDVDQARITGRFSQPSEAEFEPLRQTLRGMLVL